MPAIAYWLRAATLTLPRSGYRGSDLVLWHTPAMELCEDVGFTPAADRIALARFVQVSATPLTRGSHALQQAASQKRQGTKSRAVAHPTLRARLWGFSGVDGGEGRGAGAVRGTILVCCECARSGAPFEERQKNRRCVGSGRGSSMRWRRRRMTSTRGGWLCARQLATTSRCIDPAWGGRRP
jgi:hypothetical protein